MAYLKKIYAFVSLALILYFQVYRTDGRWSSKSDLESNRLSEEDRKYIVDSGLDPDTISPDTVIIRPPSYTDEEESSFGMPKAYSCDGCRIISYQLKERFLSEEKKKGNSKTSLPESDLIDIVESVCKDNFEGYGLMSTPSGDKFFHGPGLERPQTSGSIDKGPLWPKRLRHMCLEILDTYDEDELYKMYKDNGNDFEGTELCAKKCNNANRKTEL
ncbi:marginal zone B- and B1-cell-specific protein-like [Elysia marginata]|uniref:Marginal zone B- and B1-cell-specific protein-like n=1 Tax=Elysia marginata TaxID=1093978 RepID=A0AAV4I2A9_9GAST|nr:marginal zone B- and B1-cell-specific protein-like [Elysia marginata]